MLIAVLAVVTMLVGCSRTVEGTAAKAGSGDVPRNDNSAKQYPNLLKECEVLTEDILAKTVGADPLDIQSTFVGAVCRWQAANPAGLIDITRFWFEQGSLDNERKIAEQARVQGREPRDRGRSFDRHAPQRSQRRVRRRQRRGRRGRLVGQPAAARHRRVRDGDQADGADAGHQLLAGHVEGDQRGAAERQLVPRLRGPQHRDRRGRELRRDVFGRSLVAAVRRRQAERDR